MDLDDMDKRLQLLVERAAADERAAIAGWRDTGDEILLGKALAYTDMRATLQALRREVNR